MRRANLDDLQSTSTGSGIGILMGHGDGHQGVGRFALARNFGSSRFQRSAYPALLSNMFLYLKPSYRQFVRHDVRAM